jgi:lycopene beta-cyclase
LTAPLPYDYIIAGAGCAGLSLAMHLIESGKFRDKKIALFDKDPKRSNDRTWCFWQTSQGIFDPVVYRQWTKLWFHGEAFSTEMDIAPYQYKMIRGIDFYTYCLERISRQENMEIRFEKVDSVFSNEDGTGVVVNGEKIMSEYVFNSILFEQPQLNEKQYWLLQHFKGWIIETEQEHFDPSVATLMDFRIGQNYGTAFCYVLPFSSKKALVEYTLFSPQWLKAEQYDEGLRSYISEQLKIADYKILDEETGSIPMTNYPFPPRQNNIINMGTAGGQTKGSSGYTFNFIQKHSKALVDQMMNSGEPFIAPPAKRFHFYDSVLLNILQNNAVSGREIFTDLFKKNAPQRVLRFLDNETSFKEELKIISTLPVIPFTKAAMKQLF